MANSVTNVGFSDYTSEQADIERRRKMAELLQQQGQTPMGPTESVGGWAIQKSPLEGLGKMLQSYSGARGQKQATEEEKALGRKYQSDLARTLMEAQTAGTGKPAQDNPAVDDPAAGQYAPASVSPAVAPDRQMMARILMGHPATQQLGLQGMQQDMQRQGFMAAGGMGAPAASGGVPAAGGMPAPAGGPAQPQGATGGFGGPAGGQPMAVWLQLDPTGKAYTEQLAKDFSERGKPVVNRGYGIGTMDANGKYVPDPASVEQALQMERGKQGIQAPMEPPITLDTSGGQKVQLSRPEWADFQKTGQLPQRLGGPAPTSEPTPDERAAMAKLPPLSKGGGRVEVIPGMSQQPAAKPAGVGTVGMSQPQEDQIRQAREQAAGKEVDQTFAKDYVAFTTGGAQDAAKQISQLGDVVKQLGTPGAKLTGPFIGGVPDALLKFNKTGQNAIAMRERVEEVVQRSLRAILGAQFTEKEGERLIARAYNPNLSEKENAVRVGRLATQLQQAFAAKQDAANYFQKNNTLQGWQGKMPSMSDFDPDIQKSTGQVGKTPISQATRDFLKAQGITVD